VIYPKIVPAPSMIGNEAIVWVDNLELSLTTNCSISGKF